MIGYILLALIFGWVVYSASTKLAGDLDER